MASKKTASSPWAPRCAGKTFLFTGKSWHLPQMQELVAAVDGQVVDAVSPTLDYVVVSGSGRGRPAPAKEAEKLNKKQGTAIEIVDEPGFYSLFSPGRDEAIALLKAGTAAGELWHKLCRTGRMPMPDLDHADLSGSIAAGSACFAAARLDGANFTRAELPSAIFAELHHVTFDDASLPGAHLSRMEDCSLQRVELTAARFLNAQFVRCDFTEARLQKIFSMHSQMTSCNFRGADLGDAVLGQTKFIDADFSGANLSEVQLEHCEFQDSKLVRANLSGAQLSGAKLAGCDLSGANLGNAFLLDADLSGAVVDDADFTGANITGAKLQGVDAARAKGLDSVAVRAPVAAGPNMQELENVAKNAQRLVVSAVADLPDESHANFQVDSYPWGTRCYYTISGEGKNAGRPGPHSAPIRDCMSFFAQRFADGKLRMDSIKVQAQKAALGGKELKRLALAAWCEAFGIEVPSEEDLKTQGKSRKQDQAAVREELLAELRQGADGVKKWNARKLKERNKAGAFRRVDLSGAELTGVDLCSLILDGAKFDGANLTSASFDGASLAGTSFAGAVLDGTRLHGTKGTDAVFTGARLTGANLRRRNWKQANFRDADLSRADFQFADISGADFTGATLTDTVFGQTRFDEATCFPKGFVLVSGLRWAGKGTDPRLPKAKALKVKGPFDLEKFLKRLEENSDAAKLSKALAMLKAERFKLYVQVGPDFLVGVVKSQTDPDLVYSCRLASDGVYGCCTQNLNICGGLRGSLCKHLLVLIVGTAKGGEFDLRDVDSWIVASRAQKPVLDKDAMSETFLRYKGAEAGEVDWRPTETIPEDYYAL